jgi:hypothetical protein
MDERTEAAMLDLGLKALNDVAGVRPEGYRAPMWELNFHTPKLLAERGFSYDSSLMDSDHPYLLAVGDAAGAPGGDGAAASLVEVPVSWGLDDWEQYAFLPGLIGPGVIESPAKALEMWTLELDAMHRLGAAFVLCCHPFLSGRPSRAEALDRLIEHMKSLPGLWITTVGEVARHTASLNLTRGPARGRSFPRMPTGSPVLPSDRNLPPGDVVKLIKKLITAAVVAGFDETTLRAGPAGTKKYVLGAFTERYSALFLGQRTLESFRDFGILPQFSGFVVSDRYQNYFHDG